jgi:hypothetical protein
MKDAWARFMADEEWARLEKETAAQYGTLVGEIEDRTLDARLQPRAPECDDAALSQVLVCGSACAQRALGVKNSFCRPPPGRVTDQRHPHMRFISTLKRVLTSPDPNSPSCPRCHTEMVPTASPAPVAALKLATGVAVDHPLELELAVWFCENCGTRRPRFG